MSSIFYWKCLKAISIMKVLLFIVKVKTTVFITSFYPYQLRKRRLSLRCGKHDSIDEKDLNQSVFSYNPITN